MRPLLPTATLFLLCSIPFMGCAGAAARPILPTETRQMEPIRIDAQETEDGYEFTSYDAEGLFQAGVRLSRDGRCEEGLPLYDRVVERFRHSRYAAPSHYNAALCHKEHERLEEATRRFERLLADYPRSEDVQHATFQLLELYIELERWPDGLEAVSRLATDEALSPDERVEVMARHAQLLFGSGEIEQARLKARETLSYARLRPEDDRVIETYFVAAANFVLAEALGQRAAEIEVPPGNVDTQRPALEQRARLILSAQRAYFDTIRHTHPHWAAAAGYQIGAMYDAFWDAIMRAPVPPATPPLEGEDLAFYEHEYRQALASLAKPLIRHSIRYWELTLVMVERTGVGTEWTERIRADLEIARARLLEQPDGAGGIPTASPENGEAAGPRLRYPTGEGAI